MKPFLPEYTFFMSSVCRAREGEGWGARKKGTLSRFFTHKGTAIRPALTPMQNGAGFGDTSEECQSQRYCCKKILDTPVSTGK